MEEFDYVELQDEHEHYERAFKTFREHLNPTNARAAWVKLVLQHETMHYCISKLTKSSEPMRVLGIGSGSGVEDTKLITGLLTMYPTVHSTVVEPSIDLLSRYQKTVSNTEILQRANWDWRQQTWEEYVASWKAEQDSNKKFHLITTVHSIYFMREDPLDGLEQSIDELLECLEEDGVLLICLASINNGIDKMTNWPWSKFCRAKKPFTKRDVMEILKMKGLLRYDETALPEFCDVTDCFEQEHGKEARHLFDFLAHVVDFQGEAPSEVYGQFKARLQEIMVRENERCLIDVGSDIIIVHNN